MAASLLSESQTPSPAHTIILPFPFSSWLHLMAGSSDEPPVQYIPPTCSLSLWYHVIGYLWTLCLMMHVNSRSIWARLTELKPHVWNLSVSENAQKSCIFQNDKDYCKFLVFDLIQLPGAACINHLLEFKQNLTPASKMTWKIVSMLPPSPI